MCGSSSINCSSNCGSLQCKKCGNFNESLELNECSNGLESSFLDLKFTIKSLNDMYTNKENEIKKHLSNVNI